MKKRILFIIFLSAMVLSCKENGLSFEEDLKNMEDKQKSVLAIRALDLTSADHYKALKNYFRTVGDLAISLKSDPKAQKYWANQLKKNKITGFCSRYVLTYEQWQNLNNQCTISGHYLCPDEVREYSIILKSVLRDSPESLRDDFARDRGCAQWNSVL